MKIAILTLNTYINYGNRLQLFSIHKILDNNPNIKAIDTLILEFDKKKEKKKKKSKESLLLRKRRERERVFKIFSFNCFNEIGIDGNDKDKIEKISMYDYVIIGSDQVFNPSLKYPSPFDFCSFLKSEKIIVLSASFGREFRDIETKYHESFRKGLNNIIKLSVREEEGANIVKKLTGKEIKVLPDPCLCLTKDEWDKFIPISINRPKKYIFTYFLNQKKINKEIFEFIDRIVKEEELEIININNPRSEYFSSSPFSFLEYIKNAKYVITNSFHGLCFSIIFRKKFIACDIVTNLSVQSRIDNLLNIFSLQSRKFDKTKNFDFEYNNDDLETKIKTGKEEMLNFLNNGLNEVLK